MPNISHSPHSHTQAGKRYSHFAFVAMTSLFFIWGFITALNDILIPHLKAEFDLNYTQAMLVQFCFFGAYFIVSPLAGKLIERIGYIRGILTGLTTVAIGCALFYPASELKVYALFLTALFILASGITLLQVSANPYVASLGPENTATSRLNLAQALNSLGHTLGPLFGAALIFGTLQVQEDSHQAVQLPYLLLAAVTLSVALGFKFLKLADIQNQPSLDANSSSIWQHKHLVFGAVAIFLYVGAEVSIGSFLVNYFADENIGGLDHLSASAMVAYYWGGAMCGRFIGAALTRVVNPSYVLLANALIAILLLITTMASQGNLAMMSIIAVGLVNSIMFPTIFTLAIRGLGPLTSKGSGLLCQAIVGGAILPVLQGFTADSIGIQLSFIVPALAYIYIAWYAFYTVNAPTQAHESTQQGAKI